MQQANNRRCIRPRLLVAGVLLGLLGYGAFRFVAMLPEFCDELSVAGRLKRLGADVEWDWRRLSVVRVMLGYNNDLVLTDDVVVLLKELPNLWHLSLYANVWENDGAVLERTAELEGLTSLFVCGPVSDGEVLGLRGPTTLKTIVFYLTDVGDDGLRHLAIFPKLEEVRVYRSHVTAAGVRDLQESLPNVQVGWEGNVLPGDLESQVVDANAGESEGGTHGSGQQ